MALSSDEHALLADTCGNMNAAAETCRQVLDMLRSLGSSGVVDIATHNTASTAHAEAENLAKFSSGHGIYAGELTGYNLYNVEVRPSGVFAGLLATNDVLGSPSSNIIGVRSYRLFNDANEDIVDINDIPSDMLGQITLLGLTGTGRYLKNSTNQDVLASMSFMTGCSLDTDNWEKTSIKIVANGPGYGVYEFYNEGLHPFYSNATLAIGSSDHRFSTAYLSSAPDVSSDERIKKGIQDLDSTAFDFIKALRPVQFQYKLNGVKVLEADDQGKPVSVEEVPGVRQHWGFIAQEVKEAMTSAGIEDAAVWCLADKTDPDSQQSLRYEELIAPLIKTVQVLAAKVEALEAR